MGIVINRRRDEVIVCAPLALADAVALFADGVKDHVDNLGEPLLLQLSQVIGFEPLKVLNIDGAVVVVVKRLEHVFGLMLASSSHRAFGNEHPLLVSDHARLVLVEDVERGVGIFAGDL